MEERRKEEAIEGAVRVVREDIEVLAGALVVIQTKVQEHQLWMDGVDEVGWDERVAAVEARLSDYERRLVLVERRLDNLVVPATSGRLAAVEAAIASIREWQAAADERLDWRRRPPAE